MAKLLLIVALSIVPLANVTAQQRSTSPTDNQAAKLVAERDFNIEQLRFHEAMIAASSFAERTDLFCRDNTDAALANHRSSFPTADVEASLQRNMIEARQLQNQTAILESIPHGPYGITLNDLKTEYARLTRVKPPTREEEVVRQQRLNAVNTAIADYAKELDTCHTAVTFGLRDRLGQMPPLPLPTDDAMRAAAKQERDRIAQIDQELHKASDSPSH